MKLFNFFISKFFLRILGALLIGFSIYFVKTLDKNKYNELIIGLSIFGSVLFLFFDPIVKEIGKFRIKKSRQGIIQKHIKAISNFLKKYTDIKIDLKKSLTEIEESDIDYDKRDAVFIFIINKLENLNQNYKDAILLTALCNEVNNESDILKSENYKVAIAGIFERYNFLELDDEAKLILRFYSNFQNKTKLDKAIPQIDYLSKTDEVTKKYNKTYNLSLKLKLEKDQAEEFRRTLAILIRDGKLNVKELEKDLQKRINQELKNRAVKSKAFLVLTNNFHKIESVKKSLDRFPNVVYPFKQPYKLPEKIKYLHTRIIYPPENYQSASDFLEKEIKPHIPKNIINKGFFAIIPIEGTELYTIPENIDSIEKDYLKEGFESIAAYKTGVSINITELYMESLKDEINVDEILSNIPFNIFVPDIPESRKNFLISNYENIKNRFNINRLADWANINENDLRNYLIELDINRNKKTRLYKDDNWEMVAKSIVEQAVKHRNAVNN